MDYGIGSLAGGDLAAVGGLMALGVGIMILSLVLLVAFYVFFSWALMSAGKRLKINNPGLAWIPIVGPYIVMPKMAKMHWWPVLLLIGLFIPFLNIVCAILLAIFSIVWTWKICEARKKPGWWSLGYILLYIPFINIIGLIWVIVMWSILAWAKK